MQHRGEVDTVVRVEQSAKRVRAYARGALVFDTRRARLVWEMPYYPTYYVPTTDVTAELLASQTTLSSPTRGLGLLHHVRSGDEVIFDAAMSYPDSPIEALRDLVRFDWAAMDEWMEEDELVYVHPRDPYTRVDILSSSQHVQVLLDGIEIADSDQPRILFETGLPPRYYLPFTHVRRELLEESSTTSRCPYKGSASYFSIKLDTTTHTDVLWYYRSPLPESQKIAGLACFYNEHVDLYLDGVLQERPATHFS